MLCSCQKVLPIQWTRMKAVLKLINVSTQQKIILQQPGFVVVSDVSQRVVYIDYLSTFGCNEFRKQTRSMFSRVFYVHLPMKATFLWRSETHLYRLGSFCCRGFSHISLAFLIRAPRRWQILSHANFCFNGGAILNLLVKTLSVA